jgi:hypothetical protein
MMSKCDRPKASPRTGASPAGVASLTRSARRRFRRLRNCRIAEGGGEDRVPTERSLGKFSMSRKWAWFAAWRGRAGGGTE